MASIKETMSSDLMKFSISCFNVPDALLDKNESKQYFQQFGKLLRIRLRPKQKVCIVEYFNEESAVRALTESGDYGGFSFKADWTKHKSVEKRKVRKKLNTEWPMDSEIQSELDAMRGSFAPAPARANINQHFVEPTVKVTKIRQWKVEKPKTSKTKPDIISSQNTEQEVELLKIIMNSTSNSEDKYRILDARDKLIRSRTVRHSELSKISKTVGTCPDMCPEKERLMREVQHQVASYEQLAGNKGSMNHNLAVKQYSRSSADQESPLPHELRPVKVLLLTMGYLLHKIMDLCESADVNLAEWYHFLWDRTRGIRKDVTQQELCCPDSVKLVEQCARFHVFCAERLVSEDLSVFDDKINTENLTKCLQTLKYMYHDLRVQHGVVCPNEAEFRAYIVLLNLNDGNFMWEVQQLDVTTQQSPQIKFALQVYSALDKNNYVRFFKLVKSTTFLNACILLRYFNQVRYRALLTILKSYSPRQPYMQYPIVELCRTLAFEDLQTTVDFVEYYGLGLNPEKSHVVLDRRMFLQPNMPFVLDRAVHVIESKRGCSVGEVVCGAPLPTSDFQTYVPQNSFDENGFLKLTAIPKEFQAKYQEFLGKYSFNKEEVKDLNIDIQEIISDKEENVEKTPVSFSFEATLNENSMTEPDLAVLPKFASNLDENRSKSPLTITNIFWSKPPQSFTSNIFGNDSQIKPPEPAFKPLLTTDTFSFLPVNTTTNIVPAIIPVITHPEPIITTPIHFKSTWTRTVIEKPKIIVPNIEEQLKKEQDQMKKQKEKEDYDEKIIKMEMKQLKERKEKQRLEEVARVDAKIKSDVSFVLQNILTRVEEHLVRNRLNEISENIKQRKFVKRWRNLTKTSRNKRKNFFDNPAWISSKSTSSEAEELFTPSQNLTLHDIKRYKRGTPDTIKLSEQKTMETINIYNIVYRILFEKLNGNDNILNLNLFWKIGVCWGKQENNLFSLLKKAFDWQEINNDNLVVKRCYSNNGGSLTYCLKEIREINNYSFLNGLIFIHLGNIIQNAYNRLIKLLKNPVPVIIIIKDSSNNNKNLVVQQLKLNSLLKKEIITDYDVLFCSHNNLETTLCNSLKFLALHVNPKPNLQMDALPVYLRNCIGEEFWYRVDSSCQTNERLKKLLRDPNISVELHNASLQKSLDIIFDPDLLNEPSFPSEFKPFVKQQQILLPCTYEYFPDYWNSKHYLNKVKKSTECLFLPKFDYIWPPKDQCDLQDVLEEYCNRIFKDSTCVVLKLLSLLLDKIDLTSDFQEQLRLVSWADVLQVIVLEKLGNAKFFDKTHAVYTVAYKNDNLKQFRRIPWWFNIEIIKNQMKFVEIEEHNEPEVVVDDSDEEIDLDKTFSGLENVEDLEEKQKIKADFNNLTCLLVDLEESMEIQQKIMNKFQEKMTGIFNCK